MTGSAHLSYATGAAIIGGGLYAFIYKKSTRSLLASGFIGQALLTGGYLIERGQHLEGHQLSLASSAILSIFGVYRLATTRKYMPAVPILLLGTLSSAYHTKKVLEWM
eukprot:gene17364-22912_t